MRFTYTARSTAGQTLDGAIEAASPADARRKLRETGLFPLRLAEAAGGKAAGPSHAARAGRRGRVTGVDLMLATSQLAVMCRSGVDVAEAFGNVASGCQKAAMRDAFDEVVRSVTDGESLSNALARRPQVFNEGYVAAVAAGEASGRLAEVLGRLTDLLREEIQLRSTLRSVLSYPVVLVGVMALVLSAVVFFVLPQFATIFDEMEIPAPPLTRAMLDAAGFVRRNIAAVGGLAVAAVAGGAWAWRTGRLRPAWDAVTTNVAPFRDVTRALTAGRAFRMLGSMLQSGVPLVDALRLCRRGLRNSYYRTLFARLEDDVVNGRGMSSALLASAVVPRGAAQMAQTAERTGKLGGVLETVGEFYEAEGERRLRELAKLLEPLIIVVLGAIVAAVVLGVMLPIFDFSTMSRG